MTLPGLQSELDSVRRLLLAANCLIRFDNELFQTVEDVIGLENGTVGGTEEKSRESSKVRIERQTSWSLPGIQGV